MSYLLNSDEFTFKFEPYLLADVMANDVYDIALLLYREYFLTLTKQNSWKFISYLITSFWKTGMMEEKAYLFKWVLNLMTGEDAIKFVDILEQRVWDWSKSNIFIICLNPVKLGTQLIELIERLARKYNFIWTRANEIRQWIVDILLKFMNDVDTH